MDIYELKNEFVDLLFTRYSGFDIISNSSSRHTKHAYLSGANIHWSHETCKSIRLFQAHPMHIFNRLI